VVGVGKEGGRRWFGRRGEGLHGEKWEVVVESWGRGWGNWRILFGETGVLGFT
jgi:hypothetical protein